MKLSLLQLNMYLGKYLDNICAFLAKNDFDVIHLQEVVGGSAGMFEAQCFETIKEALRETHVGELDVSWRVRNEPTSYFGNATFYKKNITQIKKQHYFLKNYQEIHNPRERRIEDDSRSILALLLEKDGKQFWSVNTHLAWGPTDKDDGNKLSQGQKLVNFIKTLDEPFILSGDFNVGPQSQIINWLSEIGRNLIQEYSVQNTLDPLEHRAKHLFPPGLVVDYIFTAKPFAIEHFAVIQEKKLSDHFGLSVSVTL